MQKLFVGSQIIKLDIYNLHESNLTCCRSSPKIIKSSESRVSSKGPVERSVYFEAGEEGGEVKLVPASEPRINLSGNMESFTVSFSFIIFPPFTFHVIVTVFLNLCSDPVMFRLRRRRVSAGPRVTAATASPAPPAARTRRRGGVGRGRGRGTTAGWAWSACRPRTRTRTSRRTRAG